MNRQRIIFILYIFLFIVFSIPIITFIIFIKFYHSSSLIDTMSNKIATNEFILPFGWNWMHILITFLSIIALILIIFISIVIYLRGSVNKSKIFDKNIHYNNEMLENNLNSEYIFDNINFAYNVSYGNMHFVPYRNNLRDEYLPNNWWIY